jgi:hypothetical protein
MEVNMRWNIISCKGFPGNVGWFNFGDCMKAKLGIVFLFFILAILNKWVFGLMGVSFNLWIGALGGVVAYIGVVSLFGAFKVAMGVGLAAGIVLGIVGGYAFGSTGESE